MVSEAPWLCTQQNQAWSSSPSPATLRDSSEEELCPAAADTAHLTQLHDMYNSAQVQVFICPWLLLCFYMSNHTHTHTALYVLWAHHMNTLHSFDLR